MPESVTDRPTKAHEYVFMLSKGPRYYWDADAIAETGTNRAPGNVSHKHTEAYRNGDEYSRTKGGLLDIGARATKNKRTVWDVPEGLWSQFVRWLDDQPAGSPADVWRVATQPYANAHFATYPPKLIEPCILAGAPERACGECGAPWVRVVENHGPDKPNDHDRHTASGQTIHRGLAAAKMGSTWTRETLGFEPSCSHDDGSASGVVLDPFAGSGTTGMVALRHGRSFLGAELNPEYAEMARWRIRDDQPLFNHANEIAA